MKKKYEKRKEETNWKIIIYVHKSYLFIYYILWRKVKMKHVFNWNLNSALVLNTHGSVT